MSKGFALFLGAAECAGALAVAFGVLTQLAAIGLILVMLGAMQKKIAAWHIGFWGKHGTEGWSYDVMMILMNLVVVLPRKAIWSSRTFCTLAFRIHELFHNSAPVSAPVGFILLT